MTICKKCGVSFETEKKRGHPRKFCSHTCYNAFYDKAYARNYNREKRYGVTQNDFDHMYTVQDGNCLICTVHVNSDDMQVDHDHTTNIVRGLLCGGCNNRLGWYEKHADRITTHVNRGRGTV